MKWTISDGTTVTFEDDKLAIDGSSVLAKFLRVDLDYFRRGYDVEVDIGARPSGWLPLDTKDRWLIDRWLRTTARFRGGHSVLAGESLTDDDAPEAAREILAAFSDDTVPGAIY